MKITNLIISAAVLMAIGCTGAFAQTATSRITGTVTDSTGASVGGANVTVTNEATGVSQSQTTSDAGVYAFGVLPVGTYTVTVERSGFKKFQKTANELTVNTPLTIDIAMEVGQVTETVTVQGGGEQIQSSNATIGNVVEQKAIEALPLNGRNPLTLILQEPGVVQRSAGALGSGVHVNGARDRAYNVTIDGIDANESSVPNPVSNLYRINPDNVKEFKVTTNNATAEEGRNSGANISLATRSGGNEFHGTAFYFMRNDALNSNEWFANAQNLPKPLIKMHQYGFELGGPVKKNKTFFFGSYQGTQVNFTQPIDQTFGIPIVYTPTALSGLFRYFVRDPLVPFRINGQLITGNSPLLINPSTGALRSDVPLCGGAVTTNCIATYNIYARDPRGIGPDPVVLPDLRSRPAPNSFVGASDGLNTGSFLWNPPTQIKGPAINVRVDHNFNEANSVFARYLDSKYDTLQGDPLNGRPQVFPGFPPLGEVFRTTKNLAVNYRRVFSPRIVNSFTAGFSRFVFLFSQGEANPGWPDVPSFDFPNISEPYNNTPRTFRAVTTPQFTNNLTMVTGNHVLSFGASARWYRHVDQRGQPGGINVTPVVTFAGSVRTPPGFVTGTPGTGQSQLPTTFQASTTSNPSGRAGISSTDNTILLSQINTLLGIPARISQTFLGDLNGNAFLPFRRGDEITLWAEKHVLDQYNFYAQDEWKFRQNLTFNYGLRVEINPPPSSPGFVYVPTSPIVGTGQLVSFAPAENWFDRNNITLGPRLGLAWSPTFKTGLLHKVFGNVGQSVVRVGYGIAYDPINTFMTTAVAGRVPGLVTTCTYTLASSGAQPAPSLGCAQPPNVRIAEGFPLQLTPPTTRPSSFLTPQRLTYGNAPTLITFDPDFKLPTVHQWSLSIQRELPWGMVMQTAYLGRRGIRLMRMYDINQISGLPILPSFLAMQTNVARGCNPSGTGCPSGVTSVPVPIIVSGSVAASVVNSSAAISELGSNALGAFAERIENNTLNLKLRPNQQFNRITYIDSGGNSFYHAAQFTLRRRFASGLGLSLAYTFSKSIDDGSIDPVGASSGGGLSTTTSRAPVDTTNYRLERARSDFDRTHAFTLSGLWDFPLGRGQRFLNKGGAVNQLLGGWSVSWINTYMTGEPFSISSGQRTNNNAHTSRALVLDPTARAQLQELPNQNFAGPVYFPNNDAFALPPPGSNGAGRNIYTAAPYWNLDIGIIKIFQISERFKLQFRTEMFNALNHANFDNPRDASVGSPTFTSDLFAQACCATVAPPSTQTVIQTGESARVIQFALKLQF
ncbi:MAG TPA: carboxypeptidase regulatory-like domain-containing protein [Pyrinomonadaceae bacterium]